MKKILALLVLFTGLTLHVNAQKIASGSLDGPFSEGRINLRIDYSKALIKGYYESELLNLDTELSKDWQEGKDEMFQRFSDAVRKGAKDLRVGIFKDAGYTLVFTPSSIKDNGTLKADVTVIDNSGNVVAEISGIRGSGGHFGSYVNLVGDGLESAGNRLGYFLRTEYYSYIRKHRK